MGLTRADLKDPKWSDKDKEQIAVVLNNYKEAVKIGKKASRRIMGFTWDKSATTLLNIIKEHY
jgi:hypothetical protein